jgi:hypothetical protein
VGNLHGNGYSDTHFIIPELVSSLRVLEGPFDPRQGNFAVAGSAEFELGLAQRGITAKLMAGSFGTVRSLLLWGPAGASDATFTGVELYQTNGYGTNRDGRRASMISQYEGHSGAHTFRVGVQAYIASSHTAGVLRDDDFRAGRVPSGFFGTYDSRQGEDATRFSFWADHQSRFGDMSVRNQIFAIARSLRLRENFTGFLEDPQEPAQPAHVQRGDLIDLESTLYTLGARGSVRLTGIVLERRQEIEVGYFARGDFTSGTQRRLQAGSFIPYHLDTDIDATLGDIGLYADLNLRILSWLTLRGGVRADLFTFDVINNCAVSQVTDPSRTNPPGDQSCLSQQEHGIYREPVQRASTVGAAYLPRLSVLFGPFSGLGASFAYGLGVRSIDPFYITQDKQTPFASATSLDVGISYTHGFGSFDLALRTSFFRTRVDHDLIFSETAGRNILGGATTRNGTANAVRFTGKFFDVSANLTYVSATFDDSGLLIPYIPDLVFRLDGSLFGEIPGWRPGGKPLRGTFAVGVTYVTPRPLPQGERGNTVSTIDAHATVGWSMFEVGILCTNLMDSQYRLGEYNYSSDFHTQGTLPTLVPVRHFSAGPPRAVFFTFALNFGGAK